MIASRRRAVEIGGRTFPLMLGPSNDDLAIPFTDDVRLLEV